MSQHRVYKLISKKYQYKGNQGKSDTLIILPETSKLS